MSTFLHNEAAADDDAMAMTIPRRFHKQGHAFSTENIPVHVLRIKG